MLGGTTHMTANDRGTSPWRWPSIEPADWRYAAACRRIDLELFFTTSTEAMSRDQVETATRVCRRCPVRMACLQWALDNQRDTGIWGGLTERERQLLNPEPG